MLKNRIIPCLDVKNGRVVKGINFVDLKDAGDPVEQAKIYSNGGADEICFLDITASNENRDTIYEVVDKTSKKWFVPLTVGGGVRSVEDINKLLNCGADKVSINTAAVQNAKVVEESSRKFGSQCIVVAIDAKRNDHGWEIFTDNVIKLLNEKKHNLVFLLWGAYAGKKAELINLERHLVLNAPHPSPFSANKGFFGCKHFSKTNQHLLSTNQTPIEWQIPS